MKATLHWVSAPHPLNATVRLYDRLFSIPNPLAGEGDFTDHLNPNSLEELTHCKLEPSLAKAAGGDNVQFERLGYFCTDAVDSDTMGQPVFNKR